MPGGDTRSSTTPIDEGAAQQTDTEVSSSGPVHVAEYLEGGSGTKDDPYRNGVQTAIDTVPDGVNANTDASRTVVLPPGYLTIDAPIAIGDKVGLTVRGGPTTIAPSNGFQGQWLLEAAPENLSYIPNLSVEGVVMDLTGTEGIGGLFWTWCKNHWSLSNVWVYRGKDAHSARFRQCHGGFAHGVNLRPRDATSVPPLVIEGCNETTWTDVKVQTHGDANTVSEVPAVVLRKQNTSRGATDNLFANVSAASFDTGWRLGRDAVKNTWIGCLVEQIATYGWDVRGGEGSDVAARNCWFNPIVKDGGRDLFRFDKATANWVFGSPGSVTFSERSSANSIYGGVLGYGGISADEGQANYVEGRVYDDGFAHRIHFDGRSVFTVDGNGNVSIPGTLTENAI
jgi:hypothetical protein